MVFRKGLYGERFKKGHKAWNEGLTKEIDERVRKIGEKSGKTLKRLYKEGKIIHPFLGKHHSEESNEKNRQSHLGKKCSEETKKKLRESSKGRIVTEETRRKISEAKKGHIVTKETRKKISNNAKTNPNFGMRGKKLNKEAKRKIGLAKLGDKNSSKRPEVRKKLRELNLGEKNPNYGKHRSLKSRKKTSASHQGISLKEWTHFTSFEPYSPEFNDRLKKYLRKKFNYICQLCGKIITKQTPKKFLCIHHINYDKKDCREENLIPLCNLCNTSVNKSRKDWINFFQNKLNLNIGVT